VGAGQSELTIAEMADTTVVVLVPESGDALQVMKAGMMEIGEIFIVNKADRDGAGALAREILHRAGSRAETWNPPVLQTVATEGRGLDEVVAALQEHRAFLASSGEGQARRRRKIEQRIRRLVEASLLEEAWSRAGLRQLLEDRARAAAEGTLTAYEAAAELLTRAQAGGLTPPPASNEVHR
jgi:LAO/AO transport system kinase